MTVVLPDNWLREEPEEVTIFCVKSVAVDVIENDAPVSMTVGSSAMKGKYKGLAMEFVVQDCTETWWFVGIKPERVWNGIERTKRRCNGT